MGFNFPLIVYSCFYVLSKSLYEALGLVINNISTAEADGNVTRCVGIQI